jgi:hypothetical protein
MQHAEITATKSTHELPVVGQKVHVALGRNDKERTLWHKYCVPGLVSFDPRGQEGQLPADNIEEL